MVAMPLATSPIESLSLHDIAVTPYPASAILVAVTVCVPASMPAIVDCPLPESVAIVSTRAGVGDPNPTLTSPPMLLTTKLTVAVPAVPVPAMAKS